jgi:hypothetical protein
VGGVAGSGKACPDGSAVVTVSELGLGLDASELPTTCFAGYPCTGVARFVRPDTEPARSLVAELLSDPATQVVRYEGPNLLSRSAPASDDRYGWQVNYADVGHASWRIVIEGPAGNFELPPHELEIRPPLVMHLAARLDLGSIPAGTPFSETCQPLDFSGSDAAQEHEWRLHVTGTDACEAEPVLGFVNVFGLADRVPLSEPVDVAALDPDRPVLDICLDTRGCDAEAAPSGVVLTVTPKTPLFADQVKRVALTWEVTERSFWACHGWWLLPLLAVCLLAIVIGGFVWPRRFQPHVAIRVASSAAALKRTSALGLRGLPGSGAGWYRHARLAIQGDGQVNGQIRTARVEVRAGSGGVTLVSSSLQSLDRRTRRFVDVEDAATGHIPSSHTIYRAGDVFFQVEC